MSELILVHLIEKRPMGSELGKIIPLHMTALHWFETALSPNEVAKIVQETLHTIGAMKVRTTTEDMFGPDKDVPVMRLERTPELLHLHVALVAAMQQVGAKFDERWTGEQNWNPHVTHKLGTRLYPDEEVFIRDIDLISRPSEHESRRIEYRFGLLT